MTEHPTTGAWRERITSLIGLLALAGVVPPQTHMAADLILAAISGVAMVGIPAMSKQRAEKLGATFKKIAEKLPVGPGQVLVNGQYTPVKSLDDRFVFWTSKLPVPARKLLIPQLSPLGHTAAYYLAILGLAATATQSARLANSEQRLEAQPAPAVVQPNVADGEGVESLQREVTQLNTELVLARDAVGTAQAAQEDAIAIAAKMSAEADALRRLNAAQTRLLEAERAANEALRARLAAASQQEEPQPQPPAWGN